MVLCAYLRIVVFTLFITLASALFLPVFADDLGLGVATYVPIIDKNVADGSVIISTPEGFYLSRYPYDNTIAGVITANPAVVLGLKLADNDFALNTKGTVNVRVSTVNGPIQTGDLLTSSLVPGVAMRATRAGTVIGTALSSYVEKDTTKVGVVPVLLNIYFTQDINDKKATTANPVATYWRPSLGVIIAVVTVILSFVFFGRLSASTIEALGRNPSAAGRIRFGILVQVLLLLMLAGTGGFIAYILVMP
jgi:hypothetical protein